MKKLIFIDIISCLYIILFLYTGIYKLIGNADFRLAMEKSPLLQKYAVQISIFIPILELLIATSLLFPFFTNLLWPRKWGLYVGTFLMALFTIYVGYMLIASSQLPCTCGGIIQKMNWHQHFYFNISFTLLGLISLLLIGRRNTSITNDLSLS